MSNLAYDLMTERDDLVPAAVQPGRLLEIARVPRIAIHAFCETEAVAASVDAAFSDRRMVRAHAKFELGGVRAAIDYFRQAPTPNLLVLETGANTDKLLAELAALAEVCDKGTQLLLIGHSNDIALYRALLDRGIAEYMTAPIAPLTIIEQISRLYSKPEQKLGRTFAFIGAKGGVGSSTIAQNLAWTIAERSRLNVLIADMDLPFGSAGLNFNVDPGPGMAEAVGGSGRLDELLLERLMIKRGDHLNLLASPGDLKAICDLGREAFDRIVECAQATAPYVVLDVPHLWSAWVEKTLLGADEIVITAAPDLANLRNAKHLIDRLNQARPNDEPPKLVLNQVGLPKRREIKPNDFSDALGIKLLGCIGFEALAFSTASNNGQMIGEAAPKAKACAVFEECAAALAGRRARKHAGGALGLLSRLWKR